MKVCSVDPKISTPSQKEYKVWYNAPADNIAEEFHVEKNKFADVIDMNWYLALPLGNGRMGGMVFGRTEKERIQLNEESVWAGLPRPEPKEGMAPLIQKARELIYAGEYDEAQRLIGEEVMQPDVRPRSYQTMGDLYMELPGHDTYTDYYRDLDLATGVASVRYTKDDVVYTRQVFISTADNVLVVRMTSSEPKKLAMNVTLDRSENAEITALGQDAVVMRGQAGHGDKNKGVKFCTAVRAFSRDGSVSTEQGKVAIKDATAVTLILSCATDYNIVTPLEPLTEDILTVAEKRIADAAEMPYAELLKRHSDIHNEVFRRMDIALTDDAAVNAPMDQRIHDAKAGKVDHHLFEMYFQFGRYMLMGSSMNCQLPTNLQGIWNANIPSAWDSDYHININVQMNYWIAQTANLAECHEPYLRFLRDLAESGKETAEKTYGCRGTVAHYTTDLWRGTALAGGPQYGMWVVALAWCCRDFFERYHFDGDKVALKEEVYPVVKEICLFFADWLCEHPRTGKLVSGPTTSPENAFYSNNGNPVALSMGPSMDQQIISELFDNFVFMCDELGIQDDFVEEIKDKRARLAQPRINKDGRLAEWEEGLREVRPNHRHISHLYGVFPGCMFDADETPEYIEACKKSLARRLEAGSGHTGWSRAWIINFYARFRDGEKALENLNALMEKATSANLLDIHPPFQIDGNFGGTSAICEMLLQSQKSCLHLLPALPKAWDCGKIEGLKARGGFTVDIYWQNNRLTKAVVKSQRGGLCRVKWQGQEITLETEAGGCYTVVPE